MPVQQSKRWCFTHPNPDYSTGGPMDLDLLCSYYIMGNEIAPTTGTTHIQGYCIFKKNMSLAAVKKVCSKSHWEIAKGTSDQNIAYCSKEDGYMFHDLRKSKNIWFEA